MYVPYFILVKLAQIFTKILVTLSFGLTKLINQMDYPKLAKILINVQKYSDDKSLDAQTHELTHIITRRRTDPIQNASGTIVTARRYAIARY